MRGCYLPTRVGNSSHYLRVQGLTVSIQRGPRGVGDAHHFLCIHSLTLSVHLLTRTLPRSGESLVGRFRAEIPGALLTDRQFRNTLVQ